MLLTQKFQLQRAVKDLPVLIVPGLRNSDQEHWQSLWQAGLPKSTRIQVDDKQVGHINSDSNLGIWPEGVRQLHRLLGKVNNNFKLPQLCINTGFGQPAQYRI